MRKVLITAVFFIIIGFTYAENQDNSQVEVEEKKPDLAQYQLPSGDDSFMDKYFLIERFKFLPVIREKTEEIGITIEQMEEIKRFYRDYYDLMVQKANEIKTKEEELKKLVLEGGEAKKIKQLIVDIAKLKAELTIYNIKEVRAIQNALSESQWKKVLELSKEKVF
ncbi:hypothetical protein [Persephonella sp.]